MYLLRLNLSVLVEFGFLLVIDLCLWLGCILLWFKEHCFVLWSFCEVVLDMVEDEARVVYFIFIHMNCL